MAFVSRKANQQKQHHGIGRKHKQQSKKSPPE